MRGADTLIPARFLTLIGHLCVMITLLWGSQTSVKLCLPSQHHLTYFQLYQDRLVAGFGASIALILLELITFMSGLTMFSPSVSLLSIGGHGFASIILSYFVLDGWFCDWFWPVFVFCSVLPSLLDTITALFTVPSEQQQLTKSPARAEGWSLFLVAAGVVTTFGLSVPVGYNIGVVNTPAEIIKSFCNESFVSRYSAPLQEAWLSVLWSCVVSIFIVGGCTGSILGATLANKLGRKYATVVTSLLFLAGAVCFQFCRAANSVEMLIAGRLLVGLASGLTTSIVPMYLTELSPLHLTGAMGVACPMGVNVGVLLGQVMGLSFILGGVDDWPYLLSIYAILVIICLPVLIILPESPKYLFVIKRNEETASKELSRLRGVSSSILTDEINLLREEVAAEATSASSRDSYTMISVLKERRLMLPLLLACSMQAGQQTSGINAVFYYSQTIFKSAGLSEQDSQYATIGCGFINVCTALLMLHLLPRVGRRVLLLGSVACAATILALLCAALVNMNAVSWMPTVCMIAVLSYVLVYGLGLGPIPYFIASEIFEVGPRPAGMAWGSLANWGGNFLIGMSFPTMKETIGPYSFLVFAAITAALFVFQKIYFPETKGKTPSQVAQILSHGFSSRPRRARHPDDV